MGSAVWLYMLFIDKMTEISEGVGIVNNGYPINHAWVQENFSTIPERTYNRMIDTLRSAGYINTMRTKTGLYITINKPKKQFGKKSPTSSAKSGVSKPKPAIKIRQKLHQDPPNLSGRSAKSGDSLYIDNNTITINNNNTIKGDKKSPAKIDPHKELISKLYYEAVKALDVPVRNHKNLQAKIAEMSRDKDRDKVIKYLEFMSNQFVTVEWSYKPSINEALDIHAKRAQVRNSFKRYLTPDATGTKGIKI